MTMSLEAAAQAMREAMRETVKRHSLQAENSILKIGAGHTFSILFTGAHPINVINNVRSVSEVAVIY
jgi:adenosine/AMP kinase